MTEPVDWQDDGTPRSPRFNDIYRSESGGLEQARHVFLAGCSLPQAWRNQAQWRILETGFGLGLNFLATWRQWKDDPERPGVLHFVSVEAWPVSAQDVLRSAFAYPELGALAQELANQWFGLSPGVHRLSFEDGRVLLTLRIGDVKQALREQRFCADSVFLDGFSPPLNPGMWDLATLKALGRYCSRGTRLATWTVAADVRHALSQLGFEVRKVEGLAPKRQCTQATFAPAWEPRGSPVRSAATPGRCIVVGAGLAGTSVAASLARRGWNVDILDSAPSPAGGASGLPAGVFAPHASVDDNLLSRLSRAGIRALLQECCSRLREGEDWKLSGVLQRLIDDSGPADPAGSAGGEWSMPAGQERLSAAGLPDGPALWHDKAGWVRPSALVEAWLSHPRIRWRGGIEVSRLVRIGDEWQLVDAGGSELARAPLVVLACAAGVSRLAGHDLALLPIRGQVSWGRAAPLISMPPWPVNGAGSLLPAVPIDGQPAWLCGATFGRGDASLEGRAVDNETNLDNLRTLLPRAADRLEPSFSHGEVNAWVGVRCASIDRRPLVGPISGRPGLWVNTAMGSRGLTFAALCAEVLAAWLHAEPLPLPQRMAEALDVKRRKTRRSAVSGVSL